MPGRAPYIRGTRAEYAALAALKGEGYHATRSPQSRGVFDIIAFKGPHLRLVQVKAYQDCKNAESIAYQVRKSFDEAQLPMWGAITPECWIRTAQGFRCFLLYPAIKEMVPVTIIPPGRQKRIAANASKRQEKGGKAEKRYPGTYPGGFPNFSRTRRKEGSRKNAGPAAKKPRKFRPGKGDLK